MDTRADQGKPGEGTLVLCLHAYTGSSKRLASVVRVTLDRWPGARLICPDLPLSLWSTADPNQVVADLLDAVDAEVLEAREASRPIKNIVLVGHSIGALLARKLYVVACGETREAPFEDVLTAKGAKLPDGRLAPRPWASDVTRVVLLAGMNRGWRITHHLSLKKAALWACGAAIGNLIRVFSGKTLIISTVRQGAEFITQLRIQWIRMRQQYRSHGGGGAALTIQLLGSCDDMVAPEDNVDLVSGGDFVYLDVPYSGHGDVIEFDDPMNGQRRAEVYLQAICSSDQKLRLENNVPADDQFFAPDDAIRRVVFVIHGIRDAGYWTHKVARRIKQRQTENVAQWATETSSYGYFAMLPFVFPWYRRRKVEWLMDQYTEALARYPKAQFSYVGHSNGTYLLAKALMLYPCCAFDKVVFAGSVVPTSYAWEKLLNSDPPRVSAVLNFVATSDWVVAFFPKFFELLRLQDLGSGGHDGFEAAKVHPKVHQITYVKGGHSAAIHEPLWDNIADFVGKGVVRPIPPARRQDERILWVALLGLFPPIVWTAIVALAWGLWTLVAQLIAFTFPLDASRQFATGFGLAAYLLALWLVITRI